MHQHTATVVMRLSNREAAHAVLRALKEHDRPKHGPRLFDDAGVHFGRVLLLEEGGGVPFSSWVVLESNFDSTETDRTRAVDRHLHELVSKRPAELADLVATTTGGTFTSADALGDHLVAKSVPSTAEYQGHAHRDLARLTLERRVYDEALAIAAKLDQGTPSTVVHAQVREHLASLKLPGLDLDAPAPALPSAAVRAQMLKNKILPWLTHMPLIGLDFVPILMSAVAEVFTPQFDLQVSAEQRGPNAEALLAACASTEDRGAHNALTHVVPLKTGWVRANALAGLHRYLAGVARDYFNEVGMLGGIPSIHFAKWVLIDEGKRLLFMSNYDGNWESYLGDFVDGAASGLNAAWTCTQLYPKTIGIFLRGADDEERFKAWARANQRPTQLFYTAYPTSSVAMINNATWLRVGLHDAKLSGAALEEWRRRLT